MGSRRNHFPGARWPLMGMACVLGPSVMAGALSAQDSPAAPRTIAQVMEAIQPDEWRTLDPENTVYINLPGGQVVLELAPGFSPRHVDNIRTLVRAGHFDGGAINRAQDNYVVQWGPRRLTEGESRPAGFTSPQQAELEFSMAGKAFTPTPDRDVYAPQVGFVDGFAVGHDPATGQGWMAHCYGAIGVARGNDPNSGSGAELYAVVGHAPRHLDRNLSMVGRVVSGMEHLSVMPRGGAALGRYETRDEWVYFESVRLGSDLPESERSSLQILRTDSRSFSDLIMASRSRTEEFFVYPTDRIDVCNVRVPTR